MTKRDEFKIEITCTNCGSNKVEVELYMAQATGLLSIECLNCDNKPNESYDNEDLDESINQHLPADQRRLSNKEQRDIEDKIEYLKGDAY